MAKQSLVKTTSTIFNFFYTKRKNPDKKSKINAVYPRPKKQNPFADPSNLEALFVYICVEDLKNCRLVNAEWCLEATKYLSRRSTVRIESHEKLIKYISDMKAPAAITYNIYIDAMEIILKCTCKGWNEVDCLTDFLNEYGERVQELRLELRMIAPLEFPCIETLRNLRNVQKLIVDTQWLTFGYTIPEMPSVKKFQLIGYIDRCSWTTMDDIYRCLPNLRKAIGVPMDYIVSTSISPRQLQNLRNALILSEHVDDIDIVEKLTTKKFPLKVLKVKTLDKSCVIKSSLVRTELLKLLESTADTLMKLSLKNIPIGYCNRFQSSVLKLLSIDSGTKSLGFLQDLPNLQKLKIKCMKSTEPDAFALNTTHNLQTLEINCPFLCTPHNLSKKFQKSYETMNCCFIRLRNVTNFQCKLYLTVTHVRNLASSFPNLKILRLSHLTDEDLWIINKELPKLQELVLTAGRFSDAGIIGPSSVHEFRNTEIQRQPLQRRLLPSSSSLGNLKALAKLELHSKNLTNSGFKRILKCKQLRSISIVGSTVSRDIVEAFVTELDLRYLEMYLPLQHRSIPVLSAIQARRILNMMRGKILILSACLAPSGDSTRFPGWQIQEFIGAIQGIHDARVLMSHLAF